MGKGQVNQLTISGYSDDLVEFDGAFSEEYTLSDGSLFRVAITDGDEHREFSVGADFSDGWAFSVAAGFRGTGTMPVGIDILSGGKFDDTYLVLTIPDDAKVEVRQDK
jgi:hypothetical protein